MAGNRRKWWLAVAAAGLVLAGCSNATTPSTSSSSGAASSSSAPGVSAHQVTVGALATLSGPVAADFGAIVPGVEAYFDTVNAHGGVDGRKIVLAYKYDDGSQPTQNAIGARTLVQQDHVFAVVGVATAFFTGADFLASSGTPTFGYVTSSNWAPAPNMFGAGGSILNYSGTQPFFAYLARQLGATSIGVLAYNVPQSANECQSALAAFAKYGEHVGYADTSVNYGSDLSADVLHMKQAGVNFVLSCMDETGNISLARTMQENGLTGVKQLWLDGYDRSLLQQYPNLMVGTYMLVQHIPFEAPQEFPGSFPGMGRYLAAMKKYFPADAYSEVALEGWLSADLFVQGLRAVGPNLTQAKLVDAINHFSAYNGGGLTTPINWKYGHTVITSPACETFVAASGTHFKIVFNQGTKLWVCFPVGKPADLSHPVPAPPGTPGG
jgi:ABC-type branched-subunit amino acid transport system substrate-binding protein